MSKFIHILLLFFVSSVTPQAMDHDALMVEESLEIKVQRVCQKINSSIKLIEPSRDMIPKRHVNELEEAADPKKAAIIGSLYYSTYQLLDKAFSVEQRKEQSIGWHVKAVLMGNQESLFPLAKILREIGKEAEASIITDYAAKIGDHGALVFLGRVIESY